MFFSNSDTSLIINLDAIGSNYFILRNKVYPSLCGSVVKANAYGLGAKEVSSHLSTIGCNDFFVANIDEALDLRNTLNNSENIYVFNGIRKNQEDYFINNNIIPILNTKSEILLWTNASKKYGVNHKCVVHIDTGMNRLGIGFEYAVNNADTLSKLNTEFFMSHMSCADSCSSDFNNIQLEKFSSLKSIFPNKKFSLSNSPSIFLNDDYHFDIARPGSALYGINPSPLNSNPMNKVLTLKSKILQLRNCNKGDFIGYGASYELPQDSIIATVSVGYADGYLRSLSNKGHVYINNIRVPVIGRVSMDLITIDMTNVPGNICYEGQDVELIGNNITVDELAYEAGTIGYEILTSLGSRFKKVYISDAKTSNKELYKLQQTTSDVK